jgi:F-box-like
MSQSVTIRSLPDNVLLDIFDFHQAIINESKDEHSRDWKTLVHVCQRWRYLVLESPIRLDLQLFCTEKTPVEELLDVWPASLPLTIHSYSNYAWFDLGYLGDDFGNVVAALKHCNRVRKIHITNTVDSRWKEIVTAMHGPFPVLRSLFLDSLDSGERFHFYGTLPDTFLIGSAPCLQHLTLAAISFPSLPRFLSSTSDLTSLHLSDMPDSGYISPVTMARCLSALPKLEFLSIDFKSPTPRPK